LPGLRLLWAEDEFAHSIGKVIGYGSNILLPIGPGVLAPLTFL